MPGSGARSGTWSSPVDKKDEDASAAAGGDAAPAWERGRPGAATCPGQADRAVDGSRRCDASSATGARSSRRATPSARGPSSGACSRSSGSPIEAARCRTPRRAPALPSGRHRALGGRMVHHGEGSPVERAFEPRADGGVEGVDAGVVPAVPLLQGFGDLQRRSGVHRGVRVDDGICAISRTITCESDFPFTGSRR